MMLPLWALVALAVAGGLGAAARFVVDGALTSGIRRSYPVGTTVVNLSGSFLLGLVTGLAAAHALPAEWRAIDSSGDGCRLVPERLPALLHRRPTNFRGNDLFFAVYCAIY